MTSVRRSCVRISCSAEHNPLQNADLRSVHGSARPVTVLWNTSDLLTPVPLRYCYHNSLVYGTAPALSLFGAHLDLLAHRHHRVAIEFFDQQFLHSTQLSQFILSLLPTQTGTIFPLAIEVSDSREPFHALPSPALYE